MVDPDDKDLVHIQSEQVTEDNALDDVEPCDDAWNYANLKDIIDE